MHPFLSCLFVCRTRKRTRFNRVPLPPPTSKPSHASSSFNGSSPFHHRPLPGTVPNSVPLPTPTSIDGVTCFNTSKPSRSTGLRHGSSSLNGSNPSHPQPPPEDSWV
ncbi:hypothetical protein V6N11_001839 [Hibiscus sabdariffa]|uniref:Uncharacterized protein n=1 Tax=Hibiscus sabdariffa TaxID=183260 RepID=A0ABR2QTF9_9ROSI